MWDPHGLRNRKCECLTKLGNETLRIYRFLLLKGGESNEQSGNGLCVESTHTKQGMGLSSQLFPLLLTTEAAS